MIVRCPPSLPPPGRRGEGRTSREKPEEARGKVANNIREELNMKK
jgi:hypothetical protein